VAARVRRREIGHRRGAGQAARAKKGGGVSEKGRPLLVVEDDPALQKQIRWAFDQYETLPASDRESAMVQLRRHAPAVVTMDLGLPPDADGVTEGFRLLGR
jgi:two-component system NtrC family response regulator